MSRYRPRSGQPPALERPPPQGPAVDLLDALRRSEWEAALALLTSDAIVSAPQFDVTASGSGEIRDLLDAALDRFPDLTYQPHVRHAGLGAVLDNGFATGTPIDGPAAGDRMTTTLKVAAHEDGGHVHRLIVTVDPTPLLRALGRPVDRTAALYSDIQALRAGMYAGLDVRALTFVPLPGTPMPPGTAHTQQGRGWGSRRAVATISIASVLLAIGGAGTVVLAGHDDDQPSVDRAPTTSPARTPGTTSTPTPDSTPEPEPDVVLSTDLAFAPNSAAISPAFRTDILRLAARARNLTGVIRVDGYTDNVGSGESNDVLSTARADTVAAILTAALGERTGLTIRAIGHGEADPVARNTTAAGRAQNRRVTITLPSTSHVKT